MKWERAGVAVLDRGVLGCPAVKAEALGLLQGRWPLLPLPGVPCLGRDWC